MNQCIDPSCGGHGSCIDGTCVCSAGYKGEHCEEGERSQAGGLGHGREAEAEVEAGGRRSQGWASANEPGPKPIGLQGEFQRFARRT